jgi:predicted flap endonuclease-1-like 5' DNA nuclease
VEDESEFPVALGEVARRELTVHGITRFEQLTSLTESDVLNIHGIGPKAVRILMEELDARGVQFAG